MNRPTFHLGPTWFGGHTLWITAFAYGVLASQSFPTVSAHMRSKSSTDRKQVLDVGWNDLPALSVGAGLLCRTWILRCGKHFTVNTDLETQRASAAVRVREVYHHALVSLDQMWTGRPSGKTSGCCRCERRTERPPGRSCCPACSYRRQWCTEIQTTNGQTNFVTAKNAHPKRSMMVYFRGDWEPLEGFA